MLDHSSDYLASFKTFWDIENSYISFLQANCPCIKEEFLKDKWILRVYSKRKDGLTAYCWSLVSCLIERKTPRGPHGHDFLA